MRPAVENRVRDMFNPLPAIVVNDTYSQAGLVFSKEGLAFVGRGVAAEVFCDRGVGESIHSSVFLFPFLFLFLFFEGLGR